MTDDADDVENAAKSLTLEYSTWRSMLRRCQDPSRDDYAGRGITVCERWRDLENFIKDMGPRPSRNHTIDRIDNNGNYEPGNCRWATQAEQMRNTSKVRWVLLNGERMPAIDAAAKLGMSAPTFRGKLRRGGGIPGVTVLAKAGEPKPYANLKGLCASCSAPAEPNKRSCARHLERDRNKWHAKKLRALLEKGGG